MRKWIKTKAVFEGDLKHLGVDQESTEDFYFDANEVVAFNRSSTPHYTTIWLMGTSITITMPIEEVESLFTQRNQQEK